MKYEEKRLEYQKIPGKIENLDIDFSLADLEIILADENAIEAVYYEDSAKPVIHQDGNTTAITSRSQEENRMVLMGVGNIYGNSKIKVYLDKRKRASLWTPGWTMARSSLTAPGPLRGCRFRTIWAV